MIEGLTKAASGTALSVRCRTSRAVCFRGLRAAPHRVVGHSDLRDPSMSIFGCVRRVADAVLVSLTSTLVAVVLCLIGSGQAFAIPSPELVVGSFVSISQLLALMSAVLGGGAAYATMRA